MYNYVTCEAWKIALNELKSAKKSRGAPPRTPSDMRFWNVTCPPDLISELLRALYLRFRSVFSETQSCKCRSDYNPFLISCVFCPACLPKDLWSRFPLCRCVEHTPSRVL